jgi:hypothetical protein
LPSAATTLSRKPLSARVTVNVRGMALPPIEGCGRVR